MLIGPPVARSTSSFGLIFAPVPVDVLAQPIVQCAAAALLDLARDLGTRLDRSGIELRAEDVADGVALKAAADAAGIPMHVLQAAVAIVGRDEAEVRPHSPRARPREDL